MENENTNSFLQQRNFQLGRCSTKFQADLHNSQSRCGFYRQHKSSLIRAAQDLLEKFISMEYKQRDSFNTLFDRLKRREGQLQEALEYYASSGAWESASERDSASVALQRCRLDCDLEALLSMENEKRDSLDTLTVQLKQLEIELQEDLHFNTQPRCCKFRRQHKNSTARAKQGLLKRVFSMKKASTNTTLTQMIIQLEQFETCKKEISKGQAEIQEMIKQFLFGKNTGATLFFRVGGSMFTSSFEGIEVGKWFAVPAHDCVDSEGCISPLFMEPPHDLGFKVKPLAIGQNIFLISDAMEGDVDSKKQPVRYVHYLDTQKEKEAGATAWVKASSLEGEHAQACHFLGSGDTIYAFGFLNDGVSFCVYYIDRIKPNEGWNFLYTSENVEPFSSSFGPFHSFLKETASTIEFTTTDGKPGRRARRAFIFSYSSLLTYDFDRNSYELSELHEMFRFIKIYSIFCPDGGLFYLLIRDFRGRFCLAVYNHHKKERGFTLVLGLDDYLPEDNTRHCELPVLRLVHLGNRSMCLLWPRVLGANTEVQCTKFIVKEENGLFRAIIVSSQVYTVESFSLDNFEAVVV